MQSVGLQGWGWNHAGGICLACVSVAAGGEVLAPLCRPAAVELGSPATASRRPKLQSASSPGSHSDGQLFPAGPGPLRGRGAPSPRSAVRRRQFAQPGVCVGMPPPLSRMGALGLQPRLLPPASTRVAKAVLPNSTWRGCRPGPRRACTDHPTARVPSGEMCFSLSSCALPVFVAGSLCYT